MITIEFDNSPVELSTCVITLAYYDRNGNAVTPDSMKWSLYDRDGNVVNSRQNQTISVPGTTNDIVLSGNDLDITTYGSSRYLVAEGTYTSDVGSGLPLKQEGFFEISNMKRKT